MMEREYSFSLELLYIYTIQYTLYNILYSTYEPGMFAEIDKLPRSKFIKSKC